MATTKEVPLDEKADNMEVSVLAPRDVEHDPNKPTEEELHTLRKIPAGMP